MKKLLLALSATVMFASATYAQTTSVPGALVVNEISNGANGTKEFVELIAGSTVHGQTTVDLTNWVIDDNNGIFNGATAPGFSISGGHIRLNSSLVSSDPTFWSAIPAGSIIVLFNAGDYDSTNPNLNSAVTLGTFFQTTNTDGNNVYYFPVGITSYIQQNSSIPTASFPTDSGYCDKGTYTAPASWGVIGLSNACVGDGMQTRCPGCLTNLPGNPGFYSGISYGDSMKHYTNTSGTGFSGAHVALNDSDTVSCATAKAFQLFQGTNPGTDGNWREVGAASATPGFANSTANLGFIDSLGKALGQSFVLTACPQPAPAPTNLGVLVVTEISNGPSASSTCEYAVLTVAPCSANPGADSVNVQGWIIDDNSGNFDRSGCVSGEGISQGHYRLSYNSTWANVPVGSSIVVFTGDNNCYSLPTTSPNTAIGGIYYEPIAASITNANIQRFGSLPVTNNCVYCAASGINTYTAAASWDATVGLSNSGDAFQTRCPGCSDTHTGAPSFYHGFGYGPATGSGAFVSIPASIGNLGGPVINLSSGSNTRFFFNPTTVTSSSSLGTASNWTSGTAFAATSGSTIGSYSAALRTYILNGMSDFPCCGDDAGARTTATTAVSNVEAASSDVRVYPNPATETLYIEFSATQSAAVVTLVDMSGRVVATQSVNNASKVQFNVHSMAPGMYTYHIISNNAAQTGKVLIEK